MLQAVTHVNWTLLPELLLDRCVEAKEEGEGGQMVDFCFHLKNRKAQKKLIEWLPRYDLQKQLLKLSKYIKIWH